MKVPGTKRLKLMCNKLRSSLAFKFNLRRYDVDGLGRAAMVDVGDKRDTARVATASSRVLLGRGLHSSTSPLNLSRF